MTQSLCSYPANDLSALQGVFNVFLGAMLVSHSCIWISMHPFRSCAHLNRDMDYACAAEVCHDACSQELLIMHILKFTTSAWSSREGASSARSASLSASHLRFLRFWDRL